MLKQIYLPLRLQTRKCSTVREKKIKSLVTIDERTEKLIKENEMKPRKHPGVVHKQTIQLPDWLKKAMSIELEEYPIRKVKEHARELYHFLNGRRIPVEKEVVQNKFGNIIDNLKNDKRYENPTFNDEEKMERSIRTRATFMLKRQVYNWTAVEYDRYRSLMYMVGRGAQDYAVLYRILSEINSRDKDFKPKTLLDFGSGIGTVSWVANQFWNDSLKEHVCIDISTEISDLAAALIKQATPKIRGVFHRQYLPISTALSYDIVVSSFTFLELPDRKTRMETLFNLWKKTDKYLVLVEQGTNAGFKLMNEARELILHLWKNSKDNNTNPGHIFSPCPHELYCPRMKERDDTPCNFEVPYFELSFGREMTPRVERYSYIVIRKNLERSEKWPRIVRPVLVRSRHSICRLCTTDGKLEEIIFSAGKHERPVFYCARSSKWGDRLPMEITSPKEE